jgi:hypothetical protein
MTVRSSDTQAGEQQLSNWEQLGLESREPVLARRSARVFGIPVELVLIPGRAQRANLPGATRPSFVPDRGARIRANEALWDDGKSLVLTPNLWPFYARQGLLWRRQGTGRELREDFLRPALELARALGATLMHNTIGAAASVPMAHLHLVEAASPFVHQIAGERIFASADLELLRPRFDAASCGLRCADSARAARWATRLLELRTSPAANLVAQGELLWIVPRRRETPEQGFPYALGCAELAGRWVYQQQEAFEAAEGEELEQALLEACSPWSEGEAAAWLELAEALLAEEPDLTQSC